MIPELHVFVSSNLQHIQKKNDYFGLQKISLAFFRNSLYILRSFFANLVSISHALSTKCTNTFNPLLVFVTFLSFVFLCNMHELKINYNNNTDIINEV